MKVVGYYNSFAEGNALDKLFLSPVTHINYAFLLPNEDGTVFFYNDKNVRDVVSFAHNNGKKVFVSVGGFCNKDKLLSDVFEKICSDNEKIKQFAQSVIEKVDEYDFDGVDLDWEFPTYNFIDSYEVLTRILSESMHTMNKKFTIAVHRAVMGEPKERRIVAVTDKVVEMADWLNIMTYDSSEEQNHSSVDRCIKCYAYWHNIRKVPGDKLLVGAAFYARPSEKPYYELISEDLQNYSRDLYNGDSYNGSFTVKEKVRFSKHFCGGLIIWAINYDSLDNTSLLRAINDEL